MRKLWVAAGVVTAVIAGVPAQAMFRASDLVFVPVAASTVGLAGSNWHTDLEIRNVDTVPIDVAIIFMPSGGASNYAWYSLISNHLGGRTEDGFGYIDDKLKDIAPGHTVYLQDVIGANWGTNRKGGLAIFGLQAGTFSTTTPPGGVPAKIVVTSRTYSLDTNSDNQPLTTGQGIPGLPWYDFIDPSQKSKGLDHVTFTGIEEDDNFRTNVGLLNVSDPLTQVEVQLELFDQDGNSLKSVAILMNSLAHIQYDQAVRSLFGLSTTDVPTLTNATLTVSVVVWQSTAQNAIPGLMAYVSRVDNRTNDSVYLEQTFDTELPWDCVFNGNNCASASMISRAALVPHRRPLSLPAP
jgi:hypothetical protein